MGHRFISHRILRNLKMVNKMAMVRFTPVVDAEQNDVSQDFEEVQIPVPWGHVAGKWYGCKTVRPIVGIHGWQDNAGTFDTLAPLLPSHVGFLTLDFPGHGLSSHLPDGMYYNVMDYVHVLRLVMKEYNWEKISLIGHSMSSIIEFLFASVFPDKIDMLIGLDTLKPHIMPIHKVPETIAKRMESFIVADERNRDKNSEPPSYTYDALIEKLHLGTFASIDKDKCHYLLARSIEKSAKYPDQYFFTRDSRIKFYNYHMGSQNFNLELAKRIVAPYLFIKASGSPYFEEKKYFYEVLELLKQNHPKFEFYKVEGTHHVHLNNPERISKIINPFINKYRPPGVNSNL